MTSRSMRALRWLILGLLCLLASAALAVVPSLLPGRTRGTLLAALASLGMIAVHVAWRRLE